MRAYPNGFAVGHASNKDLNTGVTVVLPDRAVVAGMKVLGGSPGSRETDLLAPSQAVSHIDALAFSGGSAFGLDAASGVQAWLREQSRGFPAEPFRIPIVPAAILFDLRTGNMERWGRYPPYRELAYDACADANTEPAVGAIGAGTGATTASGNGGIGVASMRGGMQGDDYQICAIAACNAAGAATIGDTKHFWAAPFEVGDEFGGYGVPHPWPQDASRVRTKADLQKNTTLVAVLTDAQLSSADCERVSVMAHDGFTRALFPVHTIADGDICFTLASGLAGSPDNLSRFGTEAAICVARAIAVAVYEGSH